MRRVFLVLPLGLAALALPACVSDDSGVEDAGTFDGLAGDANINVHFDAGAGPDGRVAPPGDAQVDSTLPPEDAASDAATDVATDASIDAALDASSVDAGTANLRFVNLVPDLGTAVDLCASVTGHPLQGPFLKAAGVTAGLGYAQMTQYVSVPAAGAYHVRVVAANAADCSTALLPDATGVGAVTGYATVALTGSAADAGGHAPALQALLDDPPTGFPAYGAGARLRLLHAAPLSPPTDFFAGAGAYTLPEQAAIPYGATSSSATQAAGAATTDANGYFVEPLFVAQMTLHHATDVTSFSTFAAQSGFSVFFVGLAGSKTTPEGVLACSDTAAGSGSLTPCALETAPPTLLPMRVNQSSPLLGTTDVCFQIGSGPIVGPLLKNAGVSGGLPYPSLSGQLATVPTGTELTLYFPAPGSACNAPGVRTANAALTYAPGVTDEVLLLSSSYPSGTAVPNATPSLSAGLSPASSLLFQVVDFNDLGATGLALRTFDIFAAPADGGAAQLLEPNVPPFSGAFGDPLSAGDYSLLFATVDGGATAATLTGVSISGSSQTMVSAVNTSPTTLALTRCDLGARDAGAVTTCFP